MAKKIIGGRINPVLLIKNDDLQYLRSIIRKLLSSLEKTIDRLENVQNSEIDLLQQRHEILFGTKTSVADTLVIIANLLCNINEQKTPDNSGNILPEYKLSASDISLVEAFVQKMKSSSAENIL